MIFIRTVTEYNLSWRDVSEMQVQWRSHMMQEFNMSIDLD